mgnify:CR=1 FL=1
MAKGILIAKAGSRYDDVIEERYHFPRTYFNKAKQMVNDWIIYYEPGRVGAGISGIDRKSTRLNSSHKPISYAVFCLKKKKQNESHIYYRT